MSNPIDEWRTAADRNIRRWITYTVAAVMWATIVTTWAVVFALIVYSHLAA